jgi:hypothetical protein
MRDEACSPEDRNSDGEPGQSPVLVVILKDPSDLRRALDGGWYRVPLAHLPRRVAADFLAFYQTGAFPPGERWLVRWYAPVRGYRLATRRELIPEEPEHPHASQVYYKITLGPLQALAPPIPSERLRRITFIPTNLARLLAATEINDLWLRQNAQQRLRAAWDEVEDDDGPPRLRELQIVYDA